LPRCGEVRNVSGLYFLLPMLFTIFISFLIVRAAAIALMMTGLDRHKAVFQALSAFTGTGFTTREAERVTTHPVRRTIITWLMILGNAGLVTVIITATTSLMTSKGYNRLMDAGFIVIGVAVIYKIATSRGFIRSWERIVEDKLVKHPAFEEEGAEDLLHLMEGYGLIRLIVGEESDLAGKTVNELREAAGEVTVLGIERDRSWHPNPKGTEAFIPGDRAVVYGNLHALNNLSF
jgi:hypothetical protein